VSPCRLLAAAAAIVLLGMTAAAANYVRIQTADAFDFPSETEYEQPNGHVGQVYNFGIPYPLTTRPGRTARLTGFRLVNPSPGLTIDDIRIGNQCDTHGLALAGIGRFRDENPGARTRPVNGFTVRHVEKACWYIYVEVHAARPGDYRIDAGIIEYGTGFRALFHHEQRIAHTITLTAK
jgi:hypothetical protein